jgi:hypothetical protein
MSNVFDKKIEFVTFYSATAQWTGAGYFEVAMTAPRPFL